MSVIRITYTKALLRALIFVNSVSRFSVDCGGIWKDLPCTVCPELVCLRVLCFQSLQFLKIKTHVICNFLSLSQMLSSD